MFHFGEASLSSCSFGSHRHSLFACAAKQQGNQVFRMTRVEDTPNASGYSISNTGEQLLEKIAVTDIREKFCRFSVSVGSITPLANLPRFILELPPIVAITVITYKVVFAGCHNSC